MWIANIWRKRASPVHGHTRTLRFLSRRCSLFRGRRFALLIAPLCIHKFAVNSEAHVIPRQIIPYETGEGIVDVRQVVVQRILVGVLSLIVVSTFLPAIRD